MSPASRDMLIAAVVGILIGNAIAYGIIWMWP